MAALRDLSGLMVDLSHAFEMTVGWFEITGGWFEMTRGARVT